MARSSARNGNGNGRRLTTQQSVNAAVKSICDIMRRSNCAGALQYVPELTWILFLRILDETEDARGGSCRGCWGRVQAFPGAAVSLAGLGRTTRGQRLEFEPEYSRLDAWRDKSEAHAFSQR